MQKLTELHRDRLISELAEKRKHERDKLFGEAAVRGLRVGTSLLDMEFNLVKEIVDELLQSEKNILSKKQVMESNEYFTNLTNDLILIIADLYNTARFESLQWLAEQVVISGIEERLVRTKTYTIRNIKILEEELKVEVESNSLARKEEAAVGPVESRQKPLIFISCGQRTKEEKALGREIHDLVEGSGHFDAYYAQNQTKPEGLSENILDNLHRSAGIIAVMHRRGRVVYFDEKTPIASSRIPLDAANLEHIRHQHDRASVWIEQELAIAAYMAKKFGRKIKVSLYKQEGIEIEGLRGTLIMNPVWFESNNEVLEDLKSKVLPDWAKEITSAANSGLELGLHYESVKIDAAYHEYVLKAEFRNNGEEVADDYRLEVEFPAAVVMDGSGDNNIVQERSNEKTKFLRFSTEGDFKKLFQGDKDTHVILRYKMDNDLYQRKDLLDMLVTATLYVRGKKAQIIKQHFEDFQEF